MKNFLHYIADSAPYIGMSGIARVLIEWRQAVKAGRMYKWTEGISVFLISMCIGIVVGFSVVNSEWSAMSIPFAVASALLGERIIPLLITAIKKVLPGDISEVKSKENPDKELDDLEKK
ncbi:MAG: hypothetical protein JNM00_08355 [Flavobacteriales bacterium]|nr:hypothetical protein [Flavobacteriales bacterium]